MTLKIAFIKLIPGGHSSKEKDETDRREPQQWKQQQRKQQFLVVVVAVRFFYFISTLPKCQLTQKYAKLIKTVRLTFKFIGI